MVVLLPPPPLPPKPALLLNQQSQRPYMASEVARREATPMIHASAIPFGSGKHWQYFDPESEQLSTIRRRSKRDRNRTLGATGKRIKVINFANSKVNFLSLIFIIFWRKSLRI